MPPRVPGTRSHDDPSDAPSNGHTDGNEDVFSTTRGHRAGFLATSRRPGLIAATLRQFGLGGRQDDLSAAPVAPRDEQPLRGDLYSADQLAQHARTLAGWHEVAEQPAGPELLLTRLEDNRRVLEAAYDLIVRAAEKGRGITPAGEWLVDNFYLIEEQVRLARKHLPKGYARELPRLLTGPNASRPRVYDLALELIRHVDGQVDEFALSRFVRSYQQAASLKLGELWAVPIMLRLALLENLRRVAARVAAKQHDQDLATTWANKILHAARRDPKSVVRVLSNMYDVLEEEHVRGTADPNATPTTPTTPPASTTSATSGEPGVQLSSAFVTEFARRLQGQGHGTAFPLEWLAQALSEQGQSIDSMVQIESHRQAADQVSIGNSIGSLRFIESHDWPEWVESLSTVEQALRADPADIYSDQTFETRDRYRHAVETIARRSPYHEEQVADLAVRRARENDKQDHAPAERRFGHVGYELVGDGRRDLEQAAGMRPSLRQRLARLGRAMPLTAYVGFALLVAVAATLGVLGWSLTTGMATLLIILIAVPVFVASAQVGVTFANWLVTTIVPPRPLPRLDYSYGIPATSRTVVVVPAMLTDADRVDELISGLEIRHLANPDDHLHFALLSDLPDSDEEKEPGDEALIARAAEAVRELNRQYGYDEGEKFMFFNRPRRWNEGEQVFMGWERKRGKLTEFNRLLRRCEDGDADPALAAFDEVVAQRALLFSVEYVITLDSDTELPRGEARKLVGTMDHPLNRPVWDEEKGRVTSGYGILQPRVGVDLPSARASWFSRMMAGEPGIDPYTLTVSDVYQDAFGEGSFVGKGIYDADIFEKACGDRFPENAILSHDLIESAFARSGLVADVVFYEDYPSSYKADVGRRHRWVRGDWQIANYVLPWIQSSDGKWEPNPLSALSRWKILDNLRRSLVTPAVLAALLLAWLFHPAGAWAWTLLALGFFYGPATLKAASDLLRGIGGDVERPFRQHARDVGQSLLVDYGRATLSLAFLPFEAWKHLDAIGRTLYRVFVSRRHLLEWMTAADAEQKALRTHQSFWTAMWPNIVVAVAVLIWLLAMGAWGQTLAVLPVAALWFFSPTLAWVISRPIKKPEAAARLSTSDKRFLRKQARRTWSFFERFVSASDHFLPPDNYQEQPAEQVASRTSPTNIGLALLSNLAAHDFGYVTLGQLLDRTERTLDATTRLERHDSGHLYNWYDTQTLSPLNPRYVSSVDSGNFVASLYVLRSGLLELADQPAIGPQAWSGLADTIRLFLDTCNGRENVNLPGEGERVEEPSVKLPGDLERRLKSIIEDCESPGPTKLSGAKLLLQNLSIAASEAVAAVANARSTEAKRWASELERQVSRFAEELHHLCPWVDLVGPSPAHPYQPTDLAARQRLRLIEQTLADLEAYPTLRDVARLADEAVPAAEKTVDEVEHATVRPHADLAYFKRLARILADAAARSLHRINVLDRLAKQCEPLIECNWSILYDRGRDLLHIGYNVQERRQDAGYYDLLASEMRLGSFVLVATGLVPQEHWFRLGRQITTSGNHSALLSWSGSMFEYLMPLLVMPSYEGTLLDETYKGIVKRQIEYARTNGIRPGVPWGVSESGYSATDANLVYQYRPFGVPGLGYKRGLGEDLVIAPYASMMAVMIDPPASAANLRRLREEGFLGRYGFFEAIDYTPARIKRGQAQATVRQYMTHHQGMGFLAVASVLLGEPMQRRLMRRPEFRSAELLLHERVAKATPVYPHAGEHAGSKRAEQQAIGTLRIFTTPDTPTPEVHLLSNGRLHVMVTAAASGYTRWDGGDGTLAVTRWHEDATRDCWGTFLYLRDRETGEFWSSGDQPTRRRPERYEAIFSQARAEYRRVDRLGSTRIDDGEAPNAAGGGGGGGIASVLGNGRDEIETHTQISVSPEDDVELRRVTLTNNGRRARTIELTSYAETVLADPKADAAHPAFQNLFVQTRLVTGRQAILAKRRARNASERTPYVVHLMACYGNEVGEPEYETDRAAFVGRGRTLSDPAAMYANHLGNTSGSVLDPIVSVRRTVRLEPGEKCVFDVVTGVADTHEAAHALIEKYHDRRLNDRVGELAWTHSQIVLRQLNIDEANAQSYGRLASSVIYATPQRRAASDVIARNVTFGRKQSNLWAYGISGDLPIVLVRVSDLSKVKLVEEAVKAHSYWRRKGLRCDLVIWNEDMSGYRAEMHDAILSAIAKAGESALLDQDGGIFVRRGEQFGEEDKVLLQTIARVTLDDKAGSLAEQLDRRMKTEPQVPRLLPSQPRGGGLLGRRPPPETAAELPNVELLFRNGIGGFTPDGKEYITTTTAETPTPAPWSNVMANPTFGTIVTESGGGYTWRTNAREFRLTPFYNDPVSDTSGEALYLRDEETGQFWSPTPLPTRGAMPYTTRHGFGYSVFEYAEHGLRSETTLFVHRSEPVKFYAVRLTNQTDQRRRVSLTSYCEWVLTDQRPTGAMHISTAVDPKTQAIFARNPYNGEFGREVAFLNVSEATRTITGDRLEFLGRNRGPDDPAAMERTKLSGRVGSGFDPCGAIRIPLELGPGEEREVVFCLGAGDDENHAQALAARFASVAEANRALHENYDFWGSTLGTLHIETPDPAVNVLANGWLEYQVLSCRYWGRSGYYQSGGAYGFRDQLQDVAALQWSDPPVIREHLLRAARHQFKEGDVLHWWHPPAGKGVRTHFSDDYMWLPLVAARYVTATGDTGVLDEEVPFLEGPPVPAGQESLYQDWAHAPESGSLYDHCRRAILNGIERRGYGQHGLPLIGCGDWNDGMNLIGEHGRGESVWLAWFFITVLLDFAHIADMRKDEAFARRCREEANKLRDAAEQNAWDGDWYRRAYFDDGQPLGSHVNPECQIDSLPQSWAVLCGLADEERARSGMERVDQRLVRRDKRLIQLFDPPFDDSDLEPGYIKGYVPGVRENGGQYTHAAIWVVMAFAQMGDARRAWELFGLINPVNHAATPQDMATYKVEPYVVAADVYGVEPHVGRGGWTWYTGSAGWMLRLLVESLLGLRLVYEEGQARLYVNPLLPDGWDGFKLTYRHRNTRHHLSVRQQSPGRQVRRIVVDGKRTSHTYLTLLEDSQEHHIEIDVGGE